jgi:hypothetical protein
LAGWIIVIAMDGENGEADVQVGVLKVHTPAGAVALVSSTCQQQPAMKAVAGAAVAAVAGAAVAAVAVLRNSHGSSSSSRSSAKTAAAAGEASKTRTM